jgi:hypothetical protein
MTCMTDGAELKEWTSRQPVTSRCQSRGYIGRNRNGGRLAHRQLRLHNMKEEKRNMESQRGSSKTHPALWNSLTGL